MTEPPGRGQALEETAEWYDTSEDFDKHLIRASWERISRRCQGRSVLELGSADGLMTGYLVQRFERVAVVEGAATYAERVARLFPTAEVHRSLFEDFTTAERFDNVVAARVLEHVDDPVGLLRYLTQWLNPGGLVHIVVPNAESLHRRLGVVMGLLGRVDDLGDRDRRLGHLRVYRGDLLRQHIREAGLELLELTGSYVKPLSNAQMIDWPPEVLSGLSRLSDDLPAYAAELYALCEVPVGDSRE